MKKLPVCPAKDLPPGERRIVDVGGKGGIGVFNVDGRYYALRNICPHRKAPLCRGQVTGQVTSDGPGDAQMHGPTQVLRCPWHGWEFDITTGRSVFSPHKVRVKSYPVTVDAPPSCPHAAGDAAAEEDAAIDTYPVTVEEGVVTVHLA